MPATVKATLKAEARQDKTHAVRIRITTDRKPRYHNTGIFIAKSHWNPKATYEKGNWIRNTHHEWDIYNDTIAALVDKFMALALKNPYATAEEIITQYTHPAEEVTGRGFVAYAHEWIRRKREMQQFSAVNVYNQSLNRFLKFTGTNPPDAKYLTVHQITRFLQWLRKTEEYSVRTANDTISNLNTIYKAGVFEGWIGRHGNPFAVNPLREQEQEIERPTAEQILSLMELQDLPPKLLHARNIVLMLYFMAGARISEAIDLEWGKNVKPVYIEWLPKKRAKKLKRVKRHPGIEWVLSQYPKTGRFVFPYITEADLKLPALEYFNQRKLYNAVINKRFKVLAKMAGIEMNVSTKMLRQAYTSAAIEASDIRVAQRGVGHASVLTTEIYDKDPMQQQIDSMNEKVYGKISVKH